MGKRKKRRVISGEETPKIRKPTAPPGFSFKDKKKYTRKAKYKKGWGGGQNLPALFLFSGKYACKIPSLPALNLF